jgi:hypothetical protein
VQAPSVPWKSLAQMLHSNSSQDAITCIHPRQGMSGFMSSSPPIPDILSVLDGLGHPFVAVNPGERASGTAIQHSLGALLHQLSVFEQMSRCPILGITGLLNSGKSTLLATYLSSSGRRRVLRGLSNLAGTHRFVLWLPTQWRTEPALMGTLEAFLAKLFGHAPEPLSDQPEEATRQYNGQVLSPCVSGTDAMSIPLVAYDQGLDKVGLGLLDCPDIQTGYWSASSMTSPGGNDLAAQRQLRLASVGRLCSAFVVMTKMNSLHDQALMDVLTTLRDAMPGVTRILAVNRVKARYAPEVVAQESRALAERFDVQSVFIAYDYRSSLAATRIPPTPQGLQIEPEGDPQPIFFQVPWVAAAADAIEVEASPTGAASSPQSSPIELSYLFHLGRQLDPGALAAESCRSLVLQVKALGLEAVAWHHRNLSLRQQQLSQAWQAIAEACYEFMAQRDSSGRCIGLRIQTSPAIIAQMSDSLRRTAPLWLRPSLAIDRSARQLQQAVANKVEGFKLLQNATSAVSEFAKRFRRGEGAQVVTPERLGRSIRGFDSRDALAALSERDLQNCCQVALERFASEEQPELDPKALDRWTESIWKNMNWRDQIRRGVQPLALVTGPLLAALLIPFDSGGTAVLVFATTQELLAAAGIAVLLPTLAGGGETVRIIHEETPWRQLGDLFAVLCDCLGIPRPPDAELPRCGSDLRQLPVSRLPGKTVAVAAGATQPVLCLWQTADGSLAKLQAAAERLN